MAKQTRPAKRTQAKPQPIKTKVETEKVAEPDPTGTWGRNYFIPGFGRVNVGEAVSAASLEAWRKISKSEPKINHEQKNHPSESSD